MLNGKVTRVHTSNSQLTYIVRCLSFVLFYQLLLTRVLPRKGGYILGVYTRNVSVKVTYIKVNTPHQLPGNVYTLFAICLLRIIGPGLLLVLLPVFFEVLNVKKHVHYRKGYVCIV